MLNITHLLFALIDGNQHGYTNNHNQSTGLPLYLRRRCYQVLVCEMNPDLSVAPRPSVFAIDGPRLWLLPLLAFLALPSRAIFPEGIPSANLPWHAAYHSWFDLAIYLPLLFGLATGYLRLLLEDLVFLFSVPILSVIAVLLGWAFGTIPADFSYVVDIHVHWLRFAAAFLMFKVFVSREGAEAGVSVLYQILILLCISSLFVASLAFSEVPRLYSSAMTVATFAQVLVVCALVAMAYRDYLFLIIALIFLLFTFSRTGYAVLVCVGCVVSLASWPDFKQYAFVLFIAMLMVAAFLVFGLQYDLMVQVFEDRMRPESLASANYRTEIWHEGLSLLTTGRIPWYGVGLFGTASLAQEVIYQVLIYQEVIHHVDQSYSGSVAFHNICLELILGLGVFALPVLWWMVRKVVASVAMAKHAGEAAHLVPLGIYLVFLSTQFFDFTLYRPKEMVVWGAFLGFAEGCRYRLVHDKALRSMNFR